ncbi:MAG: hypothetical protein ABI747_04455 [Candidatus Moraniibacteriota bacterium]
MAHARRLPADASDTQSRRLCEVLVYLALIILNFWLLTLYYEDLEYWVADYIENRSLENILTVSVVLFVCCFLPALELCIVESVFERLFGQRTPRSISD